MKAITLLEISGQIYQSDSDKYSDGSTVVSASYFLFLFLFKTMQMIF